ncbi:MAG: polyphosphate polymerase domain-containing protein [Acidimicrobiia bacterium]|nr:polyphosphate polymerase domain-containing protein [Acidimicrobiia bacterium]
MSPPTQSPSSPSQVAHTSIRSFNRFELKYLLTTSQVNAFRDDLLHFVDRDAHAGPTGSYPLTSLYYDTDDHRFYWEKIDGIKIRRKLRIRSYDPAPEPATPVFVEIKQRVNSVTQKRRIVTTLADAMYLCDTGTVPQHEPRDSATYDEIAGMTLFYDLRPTVVTLYEREAYVGREADPGLRITFDSEIRYRSRNLDLTAPDPGTAAMNPSWQVMEVKVNERIPYWLTELVARHDCQLIRISKYCQCLEAAELTQRSIYFFDNKRMNPGEE